MRDHQELISLYLYGTISDEEFRQLENWIKESPDNLKAFVHETMLSHQVSEILVGDMHKDLPLVSGDDHNGPPPIGGGTCSDTTLDKQEDASGGSAAAFQKLKPISNNRHGISGYDRLKGMLSGGSHRIMSRFGYSGLAAAILIFVIGAIITAYIGSSGEQRISGPDELFASNQGAAVAVVTNVYELPSNSGITHHQVYESGDSISFDSGHLELLTSDRTRITVSGPASITFDSHSQLGISKGELVARVQAGSAGFTVRTPHGDIVDLGTEFGVKAAQDRTYVTVYDGRVSLKSTGSSTGESQEIELVAGWSSSIDGSGQISDPGRIQSSTRGDIAPSLPFVTKAIGLRPIYYHRFNWSNPGENLIGEGEYLGVLGSKAKIDNIGPGQSPQSNSNDALVLADYGSSMSIQGGMTPAFKSHAYTIMLWVKPDRIDDMHLLSGTNNTGSLNAVGPQLSITSEGTIRYSVAGEGDTPRVYTQLSESSIRADEWSHVTVSVSSNGTMNIYINGRLASKPVSLSGKLAFPHEHIVIGGAARSAHDASMALDPYVGAIDEFVFYDRVLSIKDIRAMSN